MSLGSDAEIAAAYVDGIGLIGPGFANWKMGAPVLLGEEPYRPTRTVIDTPPMLPSAERRRVGRVVKVALSAGLQAIEGNAIDVRSLATVFASSGADGENCHAICEALATVEREISPTRFHNSVHNVVSGYWGIAARATAASTSLCAFDASFGAGLLESVVQLAGLESAVLLVAYETDYPLPLGEKRPLPDAFAVGFLLVGARSERSLARIGIAHSHEPPTQLSDPSLEALRVSLPAARSLPILQRLATNQPGRCIIEYLSPAAFAVQIDPCSKT